MRGDIVSIFLFLILLSFSVSAQSYNSLFKFTPIVYNEDTKYFATGLAHYLYNTVRKDEFNDTSTGLHVNGDVFLFEKKSDPLDGGETLNGIIDTATKEHLISLNDGVFVTNRKYPYQQKIILYSNGATDFGYANDVPDDENYIPKTYFKFSKNIPAYSYTIEFEREIRSKIFEDKSISLEDRTISILGHSYYVTDTKIEGNSLELTLASAKIKDMLQEGEVKVYEINGKMYEIEAKLVSDKKSMAVLRINDETTDVLGKGDRYILSDGTEIIIKSILSNEAGELAYGDLVEIGLFSEKWLLKDSDISSDLDINHPEYNEETIEELYCSIEGSRNAEEVRIKKISVMFIPAHDYYIEPEKKLSDIVNENVNFGGIDFFFNGFDTSIEDAAIDIRPTKSNEYELVFDDKKVPLWYRDETTGVIKFGNQNDELIYQEVMLITKNDYFILTGDGFNGLYATQPSRILRYRGQDVFDNLLFFDDENHERLVVMYDENTMKGRIVLDGFEYVVEVIQDINDDGPIQVDLNSNGIIDPNEKNYLVNKVGAVIDFDSANPRITIWTPRMKEGFKDIINNFFIGADVIKDSMDSIRITAGSEDEKIEIINLERCPGANKVQMEAVLGPIVTDIILNACYLTFSNPPYRFMWNVGDSKDEEGSIPYGYTISRVAKENYPDSINIISMNKPIKNLVYLTSTGFVIANETWVTEKLPENALITQLDNKSAVVLGLCENEFYGYKCEKNQAIIALSNINGKDLLVIAGHSIKELADAVEYFENNEVKEDLILIGNEAVKMKDYIAEKPPEKKELKCKGSSHETSYYITKAGKFGIYEKHRTEIEVKVNGLKGYMKGVADVPFKAKFGVDYDDFYFHILKGDCNGEEVGLLHFHDVDGTSSSVREFELPEPGCYCIKSTNADISLDSAKIEYIEPKGEFTIEFSTS